MGSLEYYDQYWSHKSSSPKMERDRLQDEGKGVALGAQNPMIQNTHLENLKNLLNEANIGDWTAQIDHTLSYEENKHAFQERYGVLYFKTDKREKPKQEKEAKRRRYEKQAPEDAPAFDAPKSEWAEWERQRRQRERTTAESGAGNTDIEATHIDHLSSNGGKPDQEE